MLEALDARAIVDEKDRTQVIREAIAHYLGLAENSVEERVDFLEQSIDKLREQVEITEERTDLLEIQLNELNQLMAVLMGRYKK